MINIKQMTDDEIASLMQALRNEAESRIKLPRNIVPTGEIRLTLESFVVTKSGIIKNEPRICTSRTVNEREIDSIINRNGVYPILVNQLIERFQTDSLEKSGLTREDIYKYAVLIDKIKYYCPQFSTKDFEILDKIYRCLKG